MPSRKLLLEKDLVYHIYNRWFNKNNLFFNHKDYERFFKTIEKYQNEFIWIKILSYCILPNHFHFMIMSKISGNEISNFMRKVQQWYIMYLKSKYKDSDLILQFQWRFKAKQITSDEYFNKCLYYVNYNAVKHWIVGKIEDYLYSSVNQFSEKNESRFKSAFWIKINYSLGDWLEVFFDNFEEFEF